MEYKWTDITDYEGLYKIDKQGNILSKNNRIIKPYISNGYLRVSLLKSKKLKSYFIHRLMAITFIKNPDNKPQVNHKDGNKVNNKIENLEWVTGKENIQHAFKNGLIKPNYHNRDNCSITKISNDEIDIIKHLYSKGTSIKEISIQYNVWYSTIHRIIKGRKRNYKTKIDYEHFTDTIQ